MTELGSTCRATLYRAWCERPGTVSAVFFHAPRREEAWSRLCVVMSRLTNRCAADVTVCRLDGYAELVEAGTSDDPDLRVFEFGPRRWVTRPVFVEPDPSLLMKWEELTAQLARCRLRPISAAVRRRRMMPPH